ncbi:hypothetical protein GOODEAATRI_009149 [Goodea atripinnis]|uniref:Uncharacterized protein n=1 Tax=Goodea atripinnis TaxID=208336 RepID=A0ABV0N007_9TELE
MWGLIPVFDCSQLLLLCPSQCKPSVRSIPTTDARVDSPQPTMSGKIKRGSGRSFVRSGASASRPLSGPDRSCGDQGVLNSYFNTWATADISKHLPFIYNLSSIAIYSYLPAFKQYGHDAKVVHFLGKVKPWNYSYDAQTGEVRGHSVSPDPCHMHPDYLLQWWQLYATSVLPLLQKAYGDTPFSSGFVDQSSPVRDSRGLSC